MDFIIDVEVDWFYNVDIFIGGCSNDLSDYCYSYFHYQDTASNAHPNTHLCLPPCHRFSLQGSSLGAAPWLNPNEGPMIPDDLLGAFEHHLADAAVDSRYKKRSDKSVRPFGGYNVLIFGDFYQIPPIPASASLSVPLKRKKRART